MTVAKVAEEDFIRLWSEIGPHAISRDYGVSLAALHTRRRRIESVRGIVIQSPRDQVTVAANKAIVTLDVTDGQVLIGSDAHIWPGDRSTVQRAFVAFAKKLKPKAIIANGDFFDGSMISRWPSIGWESKPNVRQEIEAVKDYLADLALASPNSFKLWPLGNHDQRFETKIANAIPEYAGLKGVHLKDHFPEWTPCWRVDINDDIVVRHREYGGEHADWNNVVKGGKTIITGHDHRIGGVPFKNYAGVKWGIRCGFMGDSPLDPQLINYLEGREPNWHPGFIVLTFRGGRMMQPEFVLRVDDETVEYRGDFVHV